MKELFWTREAVDDRESIYAFIEADSPAAALALDTLFEQATRRLCAHPELGRKGRIGTTREWVVHAKYLLVYDIVGPRIRVLRLLHTARAQIVAN